MPFDPDTIAVVIAAGGDPEADLDLDTALVRQLARQELGRDADSTARESILAGLSDGLTPSEVRTALRTSFERFVSDNPIAGQNSDAFRRLSASASIEGFTPSGAQIAECIAAYRLLLGREPELAGFVNFMSGLRDGSLAAKVREVVGSSEAAEYFAPGEPPTPASALEAVLSLASQILHAAATDAALGTLTTLGSHFNELSARIMALERRIDRFIEVVLLRLDAESTR